MEWHWKLIFRTAKDRNTHTTPSVQLECHLSDVSVDVTFRILAPTGVLISLQADPTEKTIERSPFFVRREGHYCRGDLVGRTNFLIFLFEWLANLEVDRCRLFPSWTG